MLRASGLNIVWNDPELAHIDDASCETPCWNVDEAGNQSSGTNKEMRRGSTRSQIVSRRDR